MKFYDLLKERFEKNKSVICLGLDPIVEKIPLKNGDTRTKITNYFMELADSFNEKLLAVKPNIAFFEQYGADGYFALKDTIKHCKMKKLPVILDCKRGDIGNTSKAYAKSVFEDMEADAITLSPYMGEDSLLPFFEYKDKGFFILARTSNPGSSDFQMLKTEDGKFLYEKVIEKISSWNKKYDDSMGAVAGATQISELESIVNYFKNNNTPGLLIPGVGKQGGSFEDVINILHKNNYPMHKVLINSSSKILYACDEHKDVNYLKASEIEINKMDLNKYVTLS